MGRAAFRVSLGNMRARASLADRPRAQETNRVCMGTRSHRRQPKRARLLTVVREAAHGDLGRERDGPRGDEAGQPECSFKKQRKQRRWGTCRSPPLTQKEKARASFLIHDRRFSQPETSCVFSREQREKEKEKPRAASRGRLFRRIEDSLERGFGGRGRDVYDVRAHLAADDTPDLPS